MTPPLPSSPFDKRAAAWDANPGRVALARAIVDAVRNAVPLNADQHVMDFGAGTGLVSLGLLPFVREITAVDASAGMLHVLEEKAQAAGLSQLHTLLGDIAKAPLPADRFDGIVSSMTLHHLPDVPQTFRHLLPALKSGGWIALADLDTEDGSFHADKNGVFHNGFNRDDIRQWLAEAGFQTISAREAHRFSRVSASGTPKTYSIFLITARAP
jgi:ubiquinone/menaquinone biosynthesis C-methylase UbiE